MRHIRVRPEQVMDLRKNMYRCMASAVRLLYAGDEFHASVALIMSYIEALAGGGEENCKTALEEHFPDLCREVSACDFYKAYRNGFLHRFAPRSKYGLAREAHTSGDYFCATELDGAGRVLICLNVDRFIQEFLRLVAEQGEAPQALESGD